MPSNSALCGLANSSLPVALLCPTSRRFSGLAWLTLIVIALLWSPATGALDVCGSVPSGTVWRSSDSPVLVSCDLVIYDLTIEPGVDVLISGDFELQVAGTIRALGSEDSPVVLKPEESNLAGWGGIRFEDALEGSEFRWTEIEGATRSAVRLVRSYPLFSDVTFRRNAGDYGGAIRVELLDHPLQIRRSRFSENFAAYAGGAIYAVGPAGEPGAVLEIEESLFLHNHAGTTGGTRHNTSGGAIHVEGNSRILGGHFEGNEARSYTIYAAGGRYTRGGAIYLASGHSDIRASAFIGNACRHGAHGQTPDASRAYGGALYVASGELTLSNALLAENLLAGGRWRDYRGSGLFLAGGAASLINVTLVYNNSHALYRDGGELELLNSIVFFNNESEAQTLGEITASYSDVQHGLPGEGNLSLNPVLDSLHAIVAPSPAIDAGHPDPVFNDIIPPGLGDYRNDLGFTGGPGAVAHPGPDVDGDGVPDRYDAFPTDGNEWLDTDGDGVGDNADHYPNGRFADVAIGHWALPAIEALARAGITQGCGGDLFCPQAPVTRVQMAIFLQRALHGADFTPPPASGSFFDDVDQGDFGAGFIEQLYRDGITNGCNIGLFCPNAFVTRAQMAVFLLRLVHGHDYAPPAAQGLFADVAISHWAAPWIEQLAVEGVSAGCGAADYCPAELVTREQMAVFLARALHLFPR